MTTAQYLILLATAYIAAYVPKRLALIAGIAFLAMAVIAQFLEAA